MEKYTISENYLNEVIKQSATTLVGKIMRRFEVLENKEDIKKSTKELVYENFRELKELIKAFNFGVKFKSPGK